MEGVEMLFVVPGQRPSEHQVLVNNGGAAQCHMSVSTASLLCTRYDHHYPVAQSEETVVEHCWREFGRILGVH